VTSKIVPLESVSDLNQSKNQDLRVKPIDAPVVRVGLDFQAEGRILAGATDGAGVKSPGETLRWMDGGTGLAAI
jgi:hypothetical protein